MPSPSIEKLFRLLDGLGDQLDRSGGVPLERVEEVERIIGLRFPDSYREFLISYGAAKIGPQTIYGLCLPADKDPSVVWALAGLRALSPDVPVELVPVFPLEASGDLACIQCQEAGSDAATAPVVLWSLGRPLAEQALEPISSDIAEYLYGKLSVWNGLRVMEGHVRRFEEEYINGGKLPRNHIWRPYRFCVQDIVLGLVVVRHSLVNNCLEVDVCLIANVPDYEPGSGAKMTSAFLLSEAYKCGGTMEIRFTENVEGKRVPAALREFARERGVDLSHANEGRITPSEARQLFMALAEFPDGLRRRIITMSERGVLSQERACYVVNHGIWSHSELETIILGSWRPNSTLGGEAVPENRHVYMHDVAHARSAIMGGYLDRKLARRERIEGETAVDLEDDVRRLDVEFDETYYAKIYQCDEELPIPWLVNGEHVSQAVTPGSRAYVLIRARELSDLRMHLHDDLEIAAGLADLAQREASGDKIFILVPRDFDQIPVQDRERLSKTARASGVGILACPETVFSLDIEASKRLSRSRIMRQ